MAIKGMVRSNEQGYAMIMAIFAMLVAMGLCLAAAMFVQTEIRDSDYHGRLRTGKHVANAGLERGVDYLGGAIGGLSLDDPFAAIDGLDGAMPIAGEILMIGSDEAGRISVEFDVLPYTGPGSATPETDDDAWRDILLKSTGTVGYGTAFEVNRKFELLLRIELYASEVFDYAYFINHWGWWYGSSIYGYGNIRSNGQFDFGNYRPTIGGRPRFDRMDSGPPVDLVGYLDDNGDGLTNGLDGGVYAGWNIINNDRVRVDPNFYPWQKQVPMPNLTDLSYYENLSASRCASITIGGVTIVDGVQGDDVGELQNVYLEGTAQDPIVLNGPVVVRGDVIIKGVVRGKGVIYSGGNVYVPDDLEYENMPPNNGIPDGTSEQQMEAWLNNPNTQSADGLGLFAREQVVIGDYTSSTWRNNVSGWVNHSLNESKEDAGLDGIPNTANGRDGIAGTEDDDILEGDGVWTVEYYASVHEAAGLIPTGKSVGDVIPGSGEDIDGDGVFDPRTSMSEFYIDGNQYGNFDTGAWHNMPGGISSYDQIATNNIANIHAAFYTNHTFAARVINNSGNRQIDFYGAIVSRNEAIVYSASRLNVKHDLRLYGGGGAFGFDLPKTWKRIAIRGFRIDK